MKIAIDGRELRKDKITGIARYLLSFLKFAALQEPSYDYILFCNQDINTDDYGKSIKKVLIPQCSGLFWEQLLLPHYLKKEKIDLFFSPYYKASLFAPCKTIITIHDLIPLIYPERIFFAFYFAKLGKISAQRSDVIITDSQQSKKDIVNTFKVPPEKIRVVHLGVDERFNPVDNLQHLDLVKQKYGIRKKYILFLGNFKPHKNVGGVIKAYGGLSQELKNKYDLVIAGHKNKYFNKTYRLVEQLNLINNIVFAGFIVDKDLPALYSGAELFIMPSFYEGFGLPALEAMACGTPVVVSNTASIPEVVNGAGLYVNPQDSNDISRNLEKILSDESLRKDLSEKGIEQAKKFKIENSVNNILGIFKELCSG